MKEKEGKGKEVGIYIYIYPAENNYELVTSYCWY